MSTPAPTFNKLAEALNIPTLATALPQIAMLGIECLDNACAKRGGPACAWDSSQIPLPDPAEEEQPHPCVLIDVGGTQTKVGFQNGHGELRSLFDHPNTWFKREAAAGDAPLEGFLATLIAEIQRALPGVEQGCRLGLIWSNQVLCVPIETPHTRGVSGIVQGTKSGGYRKGEWFLQGVRDGDDVGALFLRALGKVGWRPSVFLLGNDTVFTLFAISHSTAGVVMSSGGNCTAIGEAGGEKGHIINTELGGHLKIPGSLLSDGDRFFAESRGVSSLSLEELAAGTWFPGLVYAHVCAAAQIPEGEGLVPLRDALVSGEVTLNNRMLVASLCEASPDRVPTAILDAGSLFTELLTALVLRGGSLAGVLCYLSVASQLANPIRPVVVALDSSMSRHFPGFYDAATSAFRLLCAGKAAEVHLVRPLETRGGSDISVPMQGMARALNTFCP